MIPARSWRSPTRAERRHRAAVRFFHGFDGALLTMAAVVTEVCALLPQQRIAQFLRDAGRAKFTLVYVPEGELTTLAEMIEKYSDRPMDFADASLLWLADALEVTDIATLDGGFHIYRTRRGRTLRNRFG